MDYSHYAYYTLFYAYSQGILEKNYFYAFVLFNLHTFSNT